MNFARLCFLSLLISFGLMMAPLGQASVPLQVPFSGQLERDGVAINSTVNLDIAIYDQSSGGNMLFRQQIGPVQVYEGHFTVILGPTGVDADGQSVALIDALAAGAEHHVEVTLLGMGEAGADIRLQQRQQLLSVPAALYVAQALDFRVRKDLTVNGDSVVQGDQKITGSTSVGMTPPANFSGADGYLYVHQGAQFQCANCGSTTNMFTGGNDYGKLLIQGRVLSADQNIHLSPPGGSRVVINDSYRAAGGSETGGAGLSVQGDIRAGSTVLECAWTACFDTGGAYFSCAEKKPGYPIMGGIDISTDDGQKPYGCTFTNAEDEIRLYCCRLATP